MAGGGLRSCCSADRLLTRAANCSGGDSDAGADRHVPPDADRAPYSDAWADRHLRSGADRAPCSDAWPGRHVRSGADRALHADAPGGRCAPHSGAERDFHPDA